MKPYQNRNRSVGAQQPSDELIITVFRRGKNYDATHQTNGARHSGTDNLSAKWAAVRCLNAILQFPRDTPCSQSGWELVECEPIKPLPSVVITFRAVRAQPINEK
jgi:hypothetical protein